MQFNQFCVYEGIKQTSECLHVKFVKMMDSQFKLFLGALNQDSAFFFNCLSWHWPHYATNGVCKAG